MQEGFIKAEVLRYDDLVKENGYAEAQRAGRTKIEGKEYIVQDGDIILIRFRT
jgi:ribosome-binding ATPase YchF (GTP1/OBG family)